MVGILAVMAGVLLLAVFYALFSMSRNIRLLQDKVSRAEARRVECEQTLYLIAASSDDPDSRIMAEGPLRGAIRKELG